MNRVKRLSGTGVVRAFVQAVREWPGWFTAAAGAVLCVLGWYGVSGERFAERQLPYLASATIPGAALIVAGGVLIAARSQGAGGAHELTDRRIDQLYALLVEPAPEEQAARVDEGEEAGTTLLAVPAGTLYHRRGCPLVTGKDSATPVDAARVRESALQPCPVCEPDPPPAPSEASSPPPAAPPSPTPPFPPHPSPHPSPPPPPPSRETD